ncbi:MAG: pantoate--beta-alanine ligase [Thermomicrobiales bacterium]
MPDRAMPVVVRTPEELARRDPSRTRGFVPTMGALHAGHQALIARAAAEQAEVVVSIFVNPTQFNDPNDLARYPRTPKRDLALAADAGATIVYMPAPVTVYPDGHATTVLVRGLTERWEGAFRPGHFDGVTTVVSILLDHIQPDRSYFGEKDFQQLAVVRRMHRDLHLPGEIVGCPIVREASGLALSSRNARLRVDERQQALALSRALAAMTMAVAAGETGVDRLLAMGRGELAGLDVEYLAIVDPATLEPVDDIATGTRALVAARVGDVRLIDTHDLRQPFPVLMSSLSSMSNAS